MSFTIQKHAAGCVGAHKQSVAQWFMSYNPYMRLLMSGLLLFSSPASGQPKGVPSASIPDSRPPRSGAPPVSAKNILGQVAIGTLGGGVGAIVGALVGKLVDCGRSCGSREYESINRISGYSVGMTLGLVTATALSVDLVGDLDSDGSGTASLVGAGLGTAGSIAIWGVPSDGVGILRIMSLPVIGAVVGYNFFRKHKSTAVAHPMPPLTTDAHLLTLSQCSF